MVNFRSLCVEWKANVLFSFKLCLGYLTSVRDKNSLRSLAVALIYVRALRIFFQLFGRHLLVVLSKLILMGSLKEILNLGLW